MLTRRTALSIPFALAASYRPRPADAASDRLTLDRPLRVSYPGAILKPALEEIGRLFSAQFPGIRTTLDPLVRSYEELAQRTLRGAMVGDIPDIVLHSTTTLRTVVDRHLVVPLDDFVGDGSDLAQLGMHPRALNFGKVGGAIYGLPWGISTPCIVYNAALTEKAGLRVGEFPKSWAGVLNLAQRIAARSDSVIGGFVEYDHTHSSMFQGLVFGSGGRMVNDNEREVAFEDEHGLAALRIIAGFRSAGMIDMSRDQARQLFSAGRLGLLVTSSSVFNNLRRQAADRFAAVFASFPIDSRSGYLPAGGPLLVLHSAEAQRRATAWHYTRFSLSAPAQAAMVREVGYFSLNPRSFNEAALTAHLATNSHLGAESVDIERLGSFADFPGENSLRISEFMKSQIQRIVAQDAEPEQVLRDLARGVNALLQ